MSTWNHDALDLVHWLTSEKFVGDRWIWAAMLIDMADRGILPTHRGPGGTRLFNHGEVIAAARKFVIARDPTLARLQ